MPTSHFHLSGSIQPSSGSKQRDRIVSHLYGVEGDLGGLLRAVEDDARAVLGAHVARVARPRRVVPPLSSHCTAGTEPKRESFKDGADIKK